MAKVNGDTASTRQKSFSACLYYGLHLQQVTGPRQLHPTPHESLANQLGEQRWLPMFLRALATSLYLNAAG